MNKLKNQWHYTLQKTGNVFLDDVYSMLIKNLFP